MKKVLMAFSVLLGVSMAQLAQAQEATNLDQRLTSLEQSVLHLQDRVSDLERNTNGSGYSHSVTATSNVPTACIDTQAKIFYYKPDFDQLAGWVKTCKANIDTRACTLTSDSIDLSCLDRAKTIFYYQMSADQIASLALLCRTQTYSCRQ